MKTGFEVQIHSKILAEAVAPALKAVEKAHRENSDALGAVFCQIRADGKALKISGAFIESEYAEKIARVLKKCRQESIQSKKQ